ncbi:TVP38/TMEM64 family protein [Geobacter hydrogenophilus]|uniref:TVP38/TMEM64 family protein n=1 Tax=Geobacter hydrogenophilus TaxID=40983 RepID=A0A9W6G3M7_9BACT|nr:TVP38/TMEM64 family protein [Geobacter hydrogenophilus]MBT0892409.1 TVP38/TMEM64 family protein [Geobacter hydrogenophilus]GLI39805.1 TVP38/TMEM64 family protein [Geobacter hydrogenophilus]
MTRPKLVAIAVIVLVVALFFATGLDRHLTLQALKTNKELFISFAEKHRLAAVSLFIAIYVAQTALSLPGAAILSLAAGAIFGVVPGTVYAVIGATLGATLAFLVTRYLFHDAVQDTFGHRLTALNRELETAGLNYLLFLRLVPLFPFFLINLAAGLTRLPLRTFFIGTLIGIIPGGFVYVNAGASLATIASPSDAASPRVLGSFALLGLFSLIPVIYRKFVRRA